jgi:1-acyl-sn-glycerol-3-phosphate acyltransferase
MTNFEEELRRIEPTIRRWMAIAMLGKKIEVRGEENFVRDGPNIIIGNHCGAFKDVGTVYKIRPRMVYFTANKAIFNRRDFDFLIRKHLRRHLKEFGGMVNSVLRPIKYLFIRFVSSNIARVGTIPVDLESSKREAMKLCVDYLLKGRAIIALQGRGRVVPSAPHPYVTPFRRGASILAYLLYDEHGISVPVTPLAMFGTQKPWAIPSRIRVRVGEPMFIRPYMSSDFGRTVEEFKIALESRVKSLFYELIKV